MSFLTLDSGPDDFTQAIISFWFRVPMAAIQKGLASGANDPGDGLDQPPAAVLAGIVPLVTFGRPQTTTTWTAPPMVTGSYSYTRMTWVGAQETGHWEVGSTETQPVSTETPVAVANLPLNPCFIGIECHPADEFGPQEISLKVNLQMDRADPPVTRTGVILLPQVASVGNWVDWEYGDAPGWKFWPQSHNNFAAVYADGKPQPIADPDRIVAIWDDLPKSSVDINIPLTDLPAEFFWPETFELGGQKTFKLPNNGGGPTPEVGKLAITPDQWHHVIISLDLERKVVTHGQNWDDPAGGFSVAYGTVSTARAWLALDGENITKFNLSQFWPKGRDDNNWEGWSDPNSILTHYAYMAATAIHPPGELDFYGFYGTFLKHHQGSPFPSFSYKTTGVPSADAPFSLPSSADYVDNIYKVEMAEFHMWTGATLDTSVAANVGLFLTDAGKDGKRKPNLRYTTKGGKGMDDVLGRPLIRLHGSGNWAKGRNTGTSGMDYSQTPPKIIPDGQFTPTAKIKPWKPNPSLAP